MVGYSGSMEADLVRCCCARASGEREKHTKQLKGLNTEQLCSSKTTWSRRLCKSVPSLKKFRFLLHVSTILPFLGVFSLTWR